jgi:hypothetical protein
MCPASMLAKRRTDRLIGRDRNEITSIAHQRHEQARHAFRHEQAEELQAVLHEAVDVTVPITSIASAKVTMMWLVTVKK